MRQSRDRRRRKLIAAAAAGTVVIAAAGVIALAVTDPGPDAQDDRAKLGVNGVDAPVEASTSTGKSTAILTLDELLTETGTTALDMANIAVMDGWSQRILGTNKVEVTTAAGQETVEFQPVAADVAALLNPDVVTAVTARMLSNDSSLRCDSTGCSDSSSDISFEEIAYPGAAGPLTEMYNGWGIDAGVWVAVLPETTSQVGNAPVLETGTVISAGFGEIFPTQTPWLESGRRDTLRMPLESVASPGDFAPVLAAGPSVPSPFAAQLSPSQLTAMSSPSVGCSVAVLCTPAPATQPFVFERTAEFAVCDTTAAAPLKLGVAAYTFSTSQDLPAPIHQLGADESGDADGIDEPIVLSSSIKFSGARVDVFDAAGLAAVAGRTEPTMNWDEEAVRSFLGERFEDCNIADSTEIADAPQSPAGAPPVTSPSASAPDSVTSDPADTGGDTPPDTAYDPAGGGDIVLGEIVVEGPPIYTDPAGGTVPPTNTVPPASDGSTVGGVVVDLPGGPVDVLDDPMDGPAPPQP